MPTCFFSIIENENTDKVNKRNHPFIQQYLDNMRSCKAKDIIRQGIEENLIDGETGIGLINLDSIKGWGYNITGNGNGVFRNGTSIPLKFENLKSKGSTIAIKFNGINDDPLVDRSISNTTKKSVLERDGNRCVNCGKNKDLEIDHKQGTYKSNINKVSTVEDLQVLCRNCNLMKRSECKRCKDKDERYRATILGYKFDYLCGTSKLTESGCLGCYLRDCIKFKSCLVKE